MELPAGQQSQPVGTASAASAEQVKTNVIRGLSAA